MILMTHRIEMQMLMAQVTTYAAKVRQKPCLITAVTLILLFSNPRLSLVRVIAFLIVSLIYYASPREFFHWPAAMHDLHRYMLVMSSTP